MSFYHIRSREHAKYEAVIHCSVLFNRFTTGRIPADAKGTTIAAELNKISVFGLPNIGKRRLDMRN